MAEEGNEDATKFINFLNMSFYEFWSIAASFIELDNKEDLLLNENIGDIHDYDAKENNNIIITIINQIDNEVNNYLEKKKEKVKKDEKELYEERKQYFYIDSIGSDEVGTGDYFGPIVVTASYVNKSDITFLEELGVKDSKKLTDKKIIKITPT